MNSRTLACLILAGLATAPIGCSLSRFASTGGIVSPSNRSQPAAPVAFPVSIGDQPVIPAYAWCARVVEPVATDANIKTKPGERVLIGIYACDGAGRTPSKNVRATYTLKDGGARQLDNVSQGIAPTPGTYLAEISRVKDGQVVRAVFSIVDPENP